MKLVGKLNVSQTLNGRQSVGGKGGGAADWEHLKNKPFETLGDDFVVDNGELQLAEDYATEEYVDNAVAAITPTIPAVSATSTLSSGTEIGSITIDGVTTTYYAPQGGSVNIDNKSLIEVDGVIQEAVPIYSEGGSVAITLNSAPGAYMDVYTKTFGGEYGEYIYNNGVVSGANYKVYFRVNYFDAEHIEIIDTFDTYGYINNLNVEQYMQSYIGYGNFTENSPCKQFNFNSFSLQSQSFGDVQTYGKVRLDYDLDSNEARRYELVCLSIEELQDSQFDETNETYHIGSSIIYHKLPNEYLNIDNETIINDNGVLKAVSGAVDWSDIANKPAFATVATSGDYDDLSNKPTIPVVPNDVSAFNNDAGYITEDALDGYATEQYVDDAIADIDLSNYATQTDLQQVEDEIPQADGTTIIDNNGVWSAVGGGSVVSITNTLSSGTAIGDLEIDGITTTLYAPAGGGGSVEIDNKSIIKNQDDELQTAANLYYEDVTTTYNAIKGWSGSAVQQDARNSEYAKAINADSSIISDYSHYYDVIVNFIPKNEANAITIKGKVNYIKLNTSNVASGDLSEYFSTIRVDQYGGHAWSSTGKVGSINWIIFPTIPYKSGYETDDVDYTERVYNQLEAGYIPVDDTIKYVDNKLHIFNDILTKGIVSSYSVDVQTNYSVSGYPLKPVRLTAKHNQTIIDSSADSTGMNVITGGELGLPTLKSSGNLSFTRSTPTNVLTIAENALVNMANQYRWIGIGYVPQSYTSGYNNTSNNSWIYGRLWCGDISNDRSDFVIEGLEAILDSWVFDTAQNKYILTFKSTIYPKNMVYWYYSSTADRSNPEYQKMNSFFFPLDNSTIIRDTTNGNIKTAIPAPPTIDGTYTLQVVVSNGEPAYSWI